MCERKISIWLVGLMCISSMGGFTKVICDGPDGHIAMEPAVHNHCQCPGTNNEHESQAGVITADHEHCLDTVAITGIMVPVRKSIKHSTDKPITAKASSIANSLFCESLLSHFGVRRCESTSFHEPLRTIVLLA